MNGEFIEVRDSPVGYTAYPMPAARTVRSFTSTWK